MPLRRMTQHVKEQNWFAVALDFVIVVVGVLIAFQVTSWNAQRSENHRERAYLERLSEEFETIEGRLNMAMNTAKAGREAVGKLLNVHKAGPDAWPDSDGAEVGEWFVLAISGVVPATPPAAFKELVSSGELSIIDNGRLRAALYEFDTLSDVALKSWQGGQEDMREFRRLTFKTFAFDMDTFEANVRDGVVNLDGAFDPDVFFGSPELPGQLSQAFAHILTAGLMAERQRTLVERINVLLAQELEK